MRAKCFVLFLAIYLLPIFTVNAEPTSNVDKINQISDEALQMVKLHRYDDAKKILQYFSDLYITEKNNNKIFTNDEMKIITLAYRDAFDALKNEGAPHDEKMGKVTTFRLVIDALFSGQQPLWTEMEEPIMSAFQNVKKAAYSGNNVNFHSNLNSFLSLYNLIYPSLRIDIPQEQVQKVDQKVSYIDQYRPKVLSKAEGQQELETLGTDLQSIFDGMTEDETDPSLWWVIISTGSIIILTLSYVGWRKYKGDRDQEKNRPHKLKD